MLLMIFWLQVCSSTNRRKKKGRKKKLVKNVKNIFNISGESKTFVYQISENHPSGTFWYHSHMHGSGGLHVEGGMAGAVIIRDRELDLSFRDITMVLQQIDLASPRTRMSYLSLGIETADNLPTNIQNFGPFTRYCMVNGDFNPLFKVFQYETTRLRFINAGGIFFFLFLFSMCTHLFLARYLFRQP